MPQDPDRIRTTYDAIAGSYARVIDGEHDRKPMDLDMLARFAREAGAGPVCDLCCGPGHTTAHLVGLGLDAWGLDVSPPMLEQARSRHPGLRYCRGDILNLDLDDGSLAGAVAFYALAHFARDQVDRAMRETFRVLRPGGLLLCTWHVGRETIRLREYQDQAIDVDFMFQDTDDMRGLLADIGFADVDIIEREPYPDIEYPSRRAYAFARKPDSPA